MSNQLNKIECVRAHLNNPAPTHADTQLALSDLASIERKLIYAKQIAAAFGRPDTPDNLIYIEAQLQTWRVRSYRAGEVLRDITTTLRALHLDEYPDDRLALIDELANLLLSPR